MKLPCPGASRFLLACAILAAASARLAAQDDDDNGSQAQVPKDPKVWEQLADRALGKGRREAAIQALAEAIHLDPKSARLRYRMGAIYAEQGSNRLAIEHFKDALRLDPGCADAHVGMGFCHLALSEYPDAIVSFDAAASLNPGWWATFFGRGLAKYSLNRYGEGLADEGRAAELDPNQSSTLGVLAWMLATCPREEIRNGPKAVEYAREACELSDWREMRPIRSLAAACAETGNFDEAVKWGTKAFDMARTPEEIRLTITPLSLYRQKKPFREQPATR